MPRMSRARVMMAASMGGPKPMYFADGFGRDDGAIGGAWTVRSGTWTILSNQAKCTAVGNVTVPCAVNVDLSAELTIPAGTASCSLVARYVNESNYVYFYIKQDGTYGLVKLIAATPTVVKTGSVSYVISGKARLVVKGTAFSFWYNGAYVDAGTISDAALQTSNLCGMRNGVAANGIFDNFVAKEL